MTDALLVLNAGSSSLKFALYAPERDAEGLPRRRLRGMIDTAGATRRFHAWDASGAQIAAYDLPQPVDTGKLTGVVIDWCEAQDGGTRLVAAGHRVVHGGSDFWNPARVTKALLSALDRLTPLAPLHQPHNLQPVRTLKALRPGLPQYLCFDTAFHHGMPRLAQIFGLPRAMYDDGIRRYGFHGLSYEYVAHHLARHDPALAEGRVVAAHLGSGASLCALEAGRSVETTMGFSATEGLLMATRSGQIDPGVVLYLLREKGMTVDEVDRLLNTASGLLGVSGMSGDMRVLLASDAPQAAEAVALFVARIAAGIAALAAGMGGLDGIVFTGGVGSHSAPIRAAVCERLRFLGVALDADANEAGAETLETPASRVALRCFLTDEEAMIAQHWSDLVPGAAVPGG